MWRRNKTNSKNYTAKQTCTHEFIKKYFDTNVYKKLTKLIPVIELISGLYKWDSIVLRKKFYLFTSYMAVSISSIVKILFNSSNVSSFLQNKSASGFTNTFFFILTFFSFGNRVDKDVCKYILLRTFVKFCTAEKLKFKNKISEIDYDTLKNEKKIIL